jgi:hypothetical protein
MADFSIGQTCNMARKQFAHHEAVSAVVPGEGLQRRRRRQGTRWHGRTAVSQDPDGQTFKTASDADDAATLQLELLVDVDAEGQPDLGRATDCRICPGLPR